MKYDIFISYRRDGGEDKARLINKKLKEMGYKVFFDHDAALRGQFETVIKTAIENSKSVLLVLSSKCFVRSSDEKDFVRREIEYAQKCGIEILPVYPVGDIEKYEELFEVKNLPQSIKELQQIQIANIDFHDNFEISCEYQIKKNLPSNIVPTNKTVLAEKTGADIHIITDTDCMIYSYGYKVGVASHNDGKYGSTIRLRKGRHKLHFESIEDDEISMDIDFIVPDNDYVDYIEVNLESAKKELEKSRLKEWNNFKKWVLRKRNELKQSKNYLILYDSSTSVYARNVSLMLQQIGNRSHLENFHDLVMTQELYSSFDEKLLGKKNILIFLKEDYDKATLSKVIEFFKTNNYEDITYVLFGNIILPPEVVAERLINIDINNRNLYQLKVDVINKICFPKENRLPKNEEKKDSPMNKMKNIDGLNMMFIEGGTYICGDDVFRHRVEVKSFYLCNTTITNSQWRRYMGGDIPHNLEFCPAVNKSISEIKEFIEKLNASNNNEFFLPSEVEWEYAARGGKKSKNYKFSGSNVLEHVGWYKDNSQHNHRAREVDAPNSTKVFNELELWFMSGNVWEVCKEYGSEEESYILRGGAYDSTEEECNVSSRLKLDLTQGYKQVGFRLAYRKK